MLKPVRYTDIVLVVLISHLSSAYHNERFGVVIIRMILYSKIWRHVFRLPTFRCNVLCVLFGLCYSCKNALFRPTIYRSAVYVKYVHMCCRDVCEGSCQTVRPAGTQGSK